LKNMSFPSPRVLQAYGLSGLSAPLGGGQGQSVQVGDAVLKPVEDADEAEWIMKIQHQLLLDKNKSQCYHLAEPLMALGGRYVVDGWTAARFMPGDTGPKGRWKEILDASRAFHRDLARIVLEPPASLTQRNHRWAKADRVAWSEDVEHEENVLAGLHCVFGQLMALRRPVDTSDAVSQLIHGDLSGNVLLTSGCNESAPGIIDFSPYWRPVEYAEAMLVTDGMLDFEGRRRVDHSCRHGQLSVADVGEGRDISPGCVE
jgi:uncharacterized protein (TIGR02569 family)